MNLKGKIAKFEAGLTESPLDDAWEGGYETCKDEALQIIKKQQNIIENSCHLLRRIVNVVENYNPEGHKEIILKEICKFLEKMEKSNDK